MPTSFTSKEDESSSRDSPVAADAEADVTSRRDDPLYYGERQSMFSARGAHPLTLENGKGLRNENNEYLLGEAEWVLFESEVSTASSRD